MLTTELAKQGLGPSKIEDLVQVSTNKAVVLILQNGDY